MKRTISRVAMALTLLAAGAAAQATPSCNGTINTTNPTKGALITCTVQHQEFLPAAPVTLTRTFGVYIPPNYSPGSSGTILKIQGTTHLVSSDCNHSPAGSENAGWLVFQDNVSTAPSVIICPVGFQDQLTSTVTDPGERWNSWGFGNSWNWRSYTGSDGKTYTGNTQIEPNDEGFLVWVTQWVQAELQTDPKNSVVTNDWIETGGLMAYQMAAEHPDLYNAAVLFNDPFGIPNWVGSLATGYTDPQGVQIPQPAAPINVLIIVGIDSAAQGMCGGNHTISFWGNLNDSRPLTVNDTIAYWQSVNQPDTFTYEPATATKFCNAVGHSQADWAGLWRYVATNGVTGWTVEVWNLYYDRDTTYCSFGPNGQVDANQCASTNPPVDWRLVNMSTNTPGNPYADTTLGFSLLQVEWNFIQRSKRP